jgi:hypothetical protein
MNTRHTMNAGKGLSGSVRLVGPIVGLLVGLLAGATGCGSGKGGSAAEIDPEAVKRCAHAYRSIADSVKGAPGAKLASREEFDAECLALTPNVQNCLAMDYALQHTEECMAVRRSLSVEERTRLRSIATR